MLIFTLYLLFLCVCVCMLPLLVLMVLVSLGVVGFCLQVYLTELRNTEYYYAVKCLKKDVLIRNDDVDCTFIERKVLTMGTEHPYLCHLFCTFQTEVKRRN